LNERAARFVAAAFFAGRFVAVPLLTNPNTRPNSKTSWSSSRAKIVIAPQRRSPSRVVEDRHRSSTALVVVEREARRRGQR
jgi:hypothetical protein